jgi:rod shape-determining protein MreC
VVGSSGVFSTRAGRRRGATYAILVALSLFLLGVGSAPPLQELRHAMGFALAPIQGALSGAARSTGSLAGALLSIDRLRTTNEQLDQENEQLRAQNQQLGEVRAENAQLTALLHARSALQYTTVEGTVVGRGVAPNERVATLDVGSARGVAVGDVVVGPGPSLVGRVVEVGGNYSRLVLLSDPRLSVVGMTQVGRAIGEVQGQLGASLAMSQIPSTEKVDINENVVTAGLSLGDCVRSPYPKGLLIGRVVDVRKDPSAIVQTALVQPAVPLDKLEFALVVTDYEGGLIGDLSACPTAGPTASPGAGASAGTSGSPRPGSRAKASPKASPTPSPSRPPISLPPPSLGGGG